MREEEEEEENHESSPLKSVKTSSLQRIFSAVETLTDDLCETDHDRQRSAEVEMSVITIGPYSEILKERKKGNLDSQYCMLSSNKKKNNKINYIKLNK